MSFIKEYYCKITHRVFGKGEIIQKHSVEVQTFPEVLNRFDEIWEHNLTQYPDIGIMFEIENRFGMVMQVGIHHEGWLMILMFPTHENMIIPIFSRSDRKGSAPFHFSEYMEFHRNCLHEEKNAKQAIKKWLDRGDMELFYIPDCDLDIIE